VTVPTDRATAPFHFELVPRACPGCGADDGRPFAPSNIDVEALNSFAFASRKPPEYMHFALVECGTCDLLYTNPAPTPDALAALYDGAAFDSSEESRLASATYGRQLARIAIDFPDRDGALDIGTGDGAFLEQLLARGFTNVVGVEPSAAPIAMAAPTVRPLVRHGVFRATDFAPASLRLVTCFQTIEHVYDPLALCGDARRLLRPGGALYLVCHDRRAILARVLGRKSPIFDLEHMQLFSRASIRALFARAGFSRVELWPLVNRYPVNYWARLFPLPPAFKPRVLSLLRASGLGALPLAAPVGNLVAIAYA
jgi:SAM-dependent methyltransferase